MCGWSFGKIISVCPGNTSRQGEYSSVIATKRRDLFFVEEVHHAKKRFTAHELVTSARALY